MNTTTSENDVSPALSPLFLGWLLFALGWLGRLVLELDDLP